MTPEAIAESDKLLQSGISERNEARSDDAGLYFFQALTCLYKHPAVEPRRDQTRKLASLFLEGGYEGLRKLLSESVIVTAVYRGSKLVVQPPELKMLHSYFELHTKTSRTAMKNNLDVFEALGLLTAAEKNKAMGGETKFGRTTLYAETAYDDKLVNSLFFDGDRRRTSEEYEKAGRVALKLPV